MIRKFKNIVQASLRHWREISFIYLIQLLIGSIVGLTFCSAICSSLNGSMVLDQLAKGFDRTVIMDVLNSEGTILDSTKTVAFMLLGVYLLISVLLHGGWLANIANKHYAIKSLLSQGLKFFFPFLGLALFSILLIALYGVIIGIGFVKIVGDPLETFSSEKPYVIWIIALIVVFILWSILVWSWSVSSRFHYISGKSFFTSIKLGFKSVWDRIFSFLAIGLLVAGFHIVLMFLYYWIMEDRGAPNWSIVILGILVQQIFAFIRVVIRGIGYILVKNLSSNS